MNEKNTWEFMKVILPIGQYNRIESPDTAPGFPDVHFQLEGGISGTMELKCAQSPNAKIPFPDTEKGLHESQLKWHRESERRGGNSWIIAEVAPFIFVIPGRKADYFNGATLEKLRDLSVVILYRDAPVSAAHYINQALKGMEIR